MTELEKVIKGLECCLGKGQKRGMCEDCPYNTGRMKCNLGEMHIDALAMLKEQEPRVMTLEAVRPIVEKNISTGECEDPWGRLFFCGACGKRINEKYNPDEDDKYCKHCGRAVKWK